MMSTFILAPWSWAVYNSSIIMHLFLCRFPLYASWYIFLLFPFKILLMIALFTLMKCVYLYHICYKVCLIAYLWLVIHTLYVNLKLICPIIIRILSYSYSNFREWTLSSKEVVSSHGRIWSLFKLKTLPREFRVPTSLPPFPMSTQGAKILYR